LRWNHELSAAARGPDPAEPSVFSAAGAPLARRVTAKDQLQGALVRTPPTACSHSADVDAETKATNLRGDRQPSKSGAPLGKDMLSTISAHESALNRRLRRGSALGRRPPGEAAADLAMRRAAAMSPVVASNEGTSTGEPAAGRERRGSAERVTAEAAK